MVEPLHDHPLRTFWKIRLKSSVERKVGHNLTEVMVVHCNLVEPGDDSSLGRGNVIDMVKMSVTVSLAAKR